MQHLLPVKSSRGSACAGGTLQVKVNLKEYRQFWQLLKIAQYKHEVRTVEELIQKEFGFAVSVRSQDQSCTVVMAQETFTWFELKYGTN